MYRLPEDKELTLNKLSEFLEEHQKEVTKRLEKLWNAYKSDYPIYHLKAKAEYKPDNRMAANFAKYITDTINGFFIGIPVKITCDDDSISAYIDMLDKYNDQDDNNAELSKLCEIFGRGYEMYYTDEESQICITYVSPMEAFMIYDDSVLERERFFVRTYKDSDDVLHGSVSNESSVRHFEQRGALKWTDEWKEHHFAGVPATEFRENEECIGIFESVLPMINQYNKALSEKANDVDYFADAYLKVLGAKLDEETIKTLRDDRIINLEGDIESELIVDFLQKPEADTTQEHLLDRLEKLIFHISMVANISDENFGTSSGIAMAYKLQAMKNLFQTKVRKFTSGMNRRYKLIFSHPASGMQKNDWVKLEYKFTPNLPADIAGEAQTAQSLEGVVSKETQLSVLSIVENTKDEIERMEKEGESTKEDIVTSRMFGGDTDEQYGVLEKPGNRAEET